MTKRARSSGANRKLELQRQLRQSQKMETLGVLAGGVAHDFNNLLTGILGFAELGLKSVPAESAAANRFGGIMTAGIRAKELVRQILCFSRAGSQPKESIELGSLVKEALVLLRATIPKTIDLKIVSDGPAVHVLGDSTQFHQILMNLCSNAHHAIGAEPGTITITVRTEEVDLHHPRRGPLLRRGNYAVLSVTDTGCGIKPEFLDKIFEPFFTTKQEILGTGIGLSLVQGLVSSSGGVILVDSIVGEGSSFHIYLPLLKGEVRSAKVVQEKAERGTARILFVDDEEMITVVGAEMLETLGYSAKSFTSSEEALKEFSLAPHTFDLVITDQAMPNLPGLQLIEKVQAIAPNIPIILTSGLGQELNPALLKLRDSIVFLAKPYSIAELSKAVVTGLNKKL